MAATGGVGLQRRNCSWQTHETKRAVKTINEEFPQRRNPPIVPWLQRSPGFWERIRKWKECFCGPEAESQRMVLQSYITWNCLCAFKGTGPMKPHVGICPTKLSWLVWRSTFMALTIPTKCVFWWKLGSKSAGEDLIRINSAACLYPGSGEVWIEAGIVQALQAAQLNPAEKLLGAVPAPHNLLEPWKSRRQKSFRLCSNRQMGVILVCGMVPVKSGGRKVLPTKWGYNFREY